MNFDYRLIELETDALSLAWFKVPWDSELLDRPVAQIQRVEARGDAAAADFAAYREWKDDQGIEFASAKIPHGSSAEARLVQSSGYRFVELNYRPEADLRRSRFEDAGDYQFIEAGEADKAELCDIAGRIFSRTRFNLDPLLGDAVAGRRYRAWMENAFDLPGQTVVTCRQGERIMAFFVQETPREDQVFWSLVGLAPGLAGRGLGRRIWSAAIERLRRGGCTRLSTSISSLNTPVLNLYARLGFRFPEPDATFHWHRRAGPSA